MHDGTSPASDSFFSETVSDDDLWSSAFLDERFPTPVSPLGWSLIRDAFERLALREPLAFLGHPEAERLGRTRLWRGHPYVPVAALASMYKLLPDWLLPDDARRYFPEGDVSQRRAAPYPPSGFASHLWRAALGTVVREAGNASPWHNHRRWRALRQQLEDGVAATEASLARAQTEADLLQAIAGLRAASEQLLAVHRWSLTHADLWFSALRRLGHRWLGPNWQSLVVRLVRGAENVTAALDGELRAIAQVARESPGGRAALAEAADLADLQLRLVAVAEGNCLWQGINQFLRRYGHRSYSLDIYHPGFAADPRQVYTLVTALAAEPEPGPEHDFEPADLPLTFWQRPWFSLLLGLSRRYLALREEQRFVWQRLLALERSAYLRLGDLLQALGQLDQGLDVLFLTADEVERLCAEDAMPLAARLARERRCEFESLTNAESSDAGESYTAFLRGNLPLAVAATLPANTLRGTPVSAGVAVGPVRVVHQASEIGLVRGGEVLVAPGVDPAWTPVFGKIVALVTESGGQLSHPAVVAREYGLPAVLAVAGATHRLATGDTVRVDGATGTVTRLAPSLAGQDV